MPVMLMNKKCKFGGFARSKVSFLLADKISRSTGDQTRWLLLEAMVSISGYWVNTNDSIEAKVVIVSIRVFLFV